jgi:uncharacterized protein (DUF58 family)
MAIDPERPLSKPLYESLPWLYGISGIFALAVSYRLQEGWLSYLLTLLGIGALVLGIVIGLRRRDFRATRSEYTRRNESFDRRDD